jgi:hypothetical protein
MSLWKVLGGAAFGVSAAGGHYGYLKYKRTNNQNPTGTGQSRATVFAMLTFFRERCR